MNNTEPHFYYSRHASLSLTIFGLIFFFLTSTTHAISVSGNITADNVTVAGDVTFSSTTISTMTVSGLINVTGITNGISGRVLQMAFSSSTVSTAVSASTWTAIANISRSFTPFSSTSYIRICLTGAFNALRFHYLTIFRDSINLGDSTYGLLSGPAHSGFPIPDIEGTGFCLTDSPGDTQLHHYQVYTTGTFGTPSYFPWDSTGYLLLEEVSR